MAPRACTSDSSLPLPPLPSDAGAVEVHSLSEAPSAEEDRCPALPGAASSLSPLVLTAPPAPHPLRAACSGHQLP